MLGNPKFNYDDVVQFTLDDEIVIGTIAIIDPWGIFMDENHVYYDVYNTERNVLIKHVREDMISLSTGE